MTAYADDEFSDGEWDAALDLYFDGNASPPTPLREHSYVVRGNDGSTYIAMCYTNDPGVANGVGYGVKVFDLDDGATSATEATVNRWLEDVARGTTHTGTLADYLNE